MGHETGQWKGGERVRKSRSPGNDTDVKIASKAVAIKSNTRVRLKKLIGEGDLLKRWETNKKKEMSVLAQGVFSGYQPPVVMVRVRDPERVSRACFERQKKETKSKSNET